MTTLLDIVSVQATQDYLLYLVFENGEKKVFDMAPLLSPSRRFYPCISGSEDPYLHT